MKNVLWHFIWLLRTRSGWPGYLMEHFEEAPAQHYWHSLSTWDRLRVYNRPCCTVPLKTDWMCGDFTFQLPTALGFNIKHSRMPVMVSKQAFYMPFLLCLLCLSWKHLSFRKSGKNFILTRKWKQQKRWHVSG